MSAPLHIRSNRTVLVGSEEDTRMRTVPLGITHFRSPIAGDLHRHGDEIVPLKSSGKVTAERLDLDASIGDVR